jgi:membrane fusion protein (multidrug efflux system)
VSYPTSIEGIINVDVRAKISGYITNVLVDEGEKVKKGQLLFKLETNTLSEQADAAKANVDAAQVEVNQLKPLVKQGIVGQTNLATAKAKLEQAKSQYHSILANIGYSDIRSPVDGYVGEIRLRRGNLVSPSDPTPMTTITDISKVYAYFSMNESDYMDFIEKTPGKTRTEKIKNLPKVTLITANESEYPYKGTIQTINSQIDKQSGSISFRAIFDNPERILTDGSTGQIRIPKTYKDAVTVPEQSTFEQQNKTLVLKVKKSGDSTIAVATVIGIKGQVRNLYLVSSGVKEGDVIVAKDVDVIPDGSPIKANEIPFDSVAKPLPVIFTR